MLIEKRTNRTQNIIFIKFLLSLIALIIVMFVVNYTRVQYLNQVYRLDRSNDLLKESNFRYKALKSQDSELQNIVTYYNDLKNNKGTFDENCFSKKALQETINQAEKKFGLQDPVKLFVSNGSMLSKNMRNDALQVKVTTIKLSYFIDKYSSALLFAQEIFSSLPKYSVIKSIEIKDYETLTPSVTKWLLAAKQPNLVFTVLVMEVRNIDLND